MKMWPRCSLSKILAYLVIIVSMLVVVEYILSRKYIRINNVIKRQQNRLIGMIRQIPGYRGDYIALVINKSESYITTSYIDMHDIGLVRNKKLTTKSEFLLHRNGILSDTNASGIQKTTTNKTTDREFAFRRNGILRDTNASRNPKTNPTITKAHSSSIEATLPPLPSCPTLSPGLVGRQTVNTTTPQTWKESEQHLPHVTVGGRWKPPNCTANQTVAIVIPYRNRDQHLRVFLRHMHPFLQRQQLHYGIYVVEQNGEPRFNRAILLNIGFLEAQKMFPYDCYIQHDVDLLPEDDHNTYTCASSPKHMTVAIDYNSYTLLYEKAFGGVTAFRGDDFLRVNGYSNLYFGWGIEDDDLYWRVVKLARMKVQRPLPSVARYTSIPHTKANASKEREKLYWAKQKRYKWDGLNSITYKVMDTVLYPLYTFIRVYINKTDIIQLHRKLVNSSKNKTVKKTNKRPRCKRYNKTVFCADF